MLLYRVGLPMILGVLKGVTEEDKMGGGFTLLLNYILDLTTVAISIKLERIFYIGVLWNIHIRMGCISVI